MYSDIQLSLMDSSSFTDAELEQAVLPVLHQSELARYATFTHRRRRHAWLAGRALLFAALIRRFGHVDGRALRTDKLGSPHYDRDGVHLSLSHCGGLIVAAVSHAAIGVDIEWPRARICVQHAQHVFSNREARQLRSLPESRRLDAFYAFWTLKEAACKAAGLSLWEGLRGACFNLNTGRFNLRVPFPARGWAFMDGRIAPGWVLAVAAYGVGGSPRIECWRMLACEQWFAQPIIRQRFMLECQN